jgi:hypothetical protein
VSQDNLKSHSFRAKFGACIYVCHRNVGNGESTMFWVGWWVTDSTLKLASQKKNVSEITFPELTLLEKAGKG